MLNESCAPRVTNKNAISINNKGSPKPTEAKSTDNYPYYVVKINFVFNYSPFENNLQ